MFKFSTNKFLFILVFVSFALTSNLTVNANQDVAQSKLLQLAKIKKTIPVIIRYKNNNQSHLGSSDNDLNTSRELRASSGDLKRAWVKGVLRKIGKVEQNAQAARSANVLSTKVAVFRNPDLVSMRVNYSELASLMSNSDIEVFEDKLHYPMLAESIPLVFPDQSSASISDPANENNQIALDGTGWLVAVIDSGVDKTHPFLNGRVVAEACFSNSGQANSSSSESLCPGGVSSSTASGSGVNCDPSMSGCGHGTQVAGIIAGSGSLDGSVATGVATGAGIISIQVYSKIKNNTNCISGCLSAYTSDLIRAYEYVYSIRDSYKIAALSVSLGTTDTYMGFCDTLAPTAEVNAINDLYNANIAFVAASGNAGETNQMSSPACIQNSVSVAATGKNSDIPWPSNNRNNTLDLFAPGVSILTPILGNGAATGSGTSLAAAHVAGAFAVLKQYNPSLSIPTLLNALQSNGPVITQGLFDQRRLHITDAVADLPAYISSNDDDEMCLPIKAINGKITVICL